MIRFRRLGLALLPGLCVLALATAGGASGLDSPAEEQSLTATACWSGSSAYADAVVGTAGLLGYWRLGDAGAGSACDGGASGLEGAFVAGVTPGLAGALVGDADAAASFDGSSGWVRVPHAASLNVGNRFSVEAWVRRDSVASGNRVVAAKQSGAWVFMFDGSNRLVLRKSGGANVASSTVTVTDTAGWHHVAATKDAASVHLYLDGVDVTGSVTDQPLVDNTLPLAIGQSSSAAFFHGGIDEVAVYGVALTAAQVAGRYTLGRPPPPPPPPAPPVNTETPTISGTAMVGETLTAAAGTWTGRQPIDYAYQWLRCDAEGESCTDIAGATAASYTLTAADSGATLRTLVTATNTDGTDNARSTQTAAVQERPLDGLSEVADPLTGSSDPTSYASNHRVAVTSGGRQLVVHGRHASGVQLAWRDGAGVWKRTTQGRVADGQLLSGTNTGDWSASIAVARDGSGEERAWVVWSADTFGSKARPLQMVRLSSLDDPAGPVVGPILTVDTAAQGTARPDLAFERSPDGSFRGCIVWIRRLSSTQHEIVTEWFTDLSADAPPLHDRTVLFTSTSSSRSATLTPGVGGLRAVVRTSSGRLQLRGHDAEAPLASWWAGASGVTTGSGLATPSAVSLASGDVLAAVESDTASHVVTVQRFGAAGTATVDLQIAGYSMPTIAAHGEEASLIMIRASDGFVVSRVFSPVLGWSQADRVEIGAEGGGGYAWPNVLREADGRLRFIVQGPAGAGQRKSVLAYQRLLTS